MDEYFDSEEEANEVEYKWNEVCIIEKYVEKGRNIFKTYRR